MEAGRPNGGLLRALGDDNGLIGVPRRGKGTASPRGSASHISVSSGDSDDGGDSRYASLGALGSKPSHSAPRQKEEKRDGRGAGPARLDEYPSFPRGRVEKSGVENADGQTGQGSRFVFTNPVRDPKSPKKAAGAVKPVQAILIDSDDEKSLPATNSKSGRPPKGAKSPAKGAGNRAIRAEDYISLADSSDGSDSDDQVAGTTVPDEARAAGSTKATPRVVERLATQPGSAPPGPGRQKIPLPAKPGSVSNPPGLPGRPASAMSNRSLESAVSVAGKASKPTPEEIEEQRKANKRARKKAARARKSEARAAAAGATTPPAAAEPADSEAGTKAEIAQPEPAAPAKPHFSFRMTGKKTEVADLSKPLFRTPSSAKDPVANKPTGPLAEDSDSEMDIESDSGSGVDLAELREQSTDASQTPDTYTNLESMRTRKKARLSTAEEDFISFAGVISEDEEEDKPKKERWKPPPMNQRDEERRRMFGDPNVAQSPLLNLPQPPWIPDGKIYLHPGGHPAAMLNQEVLDFIEYIAPRPEEHAMRQIVVERVSSAVRSVWPNARVEVFGSFDTRMYLPSSDIDLVVFEPTARPPSCLEPLARAMKNLGLVHSLEVISTARVPIIKSVDSLTLYRLDISFNMASGLESAQIVKKMLDSRVGGALKALMLVLKQFLLQRNMNEVFSGGVGSYGLMIMIANFLMLHPLIQSGVIDPMNSLGTLLMDFLELYGKNLNHQVVGIGLQLEGGGYYFPKRTGGRGGLTVIDPQDSSNDVTRGSFMYPAVRREFSNAHDLLRLTIQSHFEAAKKFELRQMERDEEELRRRSTHTRYDSDGERAALRGRGRQQRGRGGRKSTVLRPPAPPATLLGMIVRVRKSVQEHRSFVKERWDEIQSGRIDPREGKGVWGAVDGEWLAEIVEGEGREKKDAPTPPTVPKKRKADEEEEDDEVLYIEADSDEEPRMALKSKPRPAPTPAAPAGTKGPQNAVLSELLGESYDVLSGDYEMVGKVPVVFDDRRSSGRVVDTLDMQPLPKLRGLEEPRSDEENEEDKPVIITPRRPGNGWE